MMCFLFSDGYISDMFPPCTRQTGISQAEIIQYQMECLPWSTLAAPPLLFGIQSLGLAAMAEKTHIHFLFIVLFISFMMDQFKDIFRHEASFLICSSGYPIFL